MIGHVYTMNVLGIFSDCFDCMIFSVYHYIITQTEKEEQNINDNLGNDLVLNPNDKTFYIIKI